MQHSVKVLRSMLQQREDERNLIEKEIRQLERELLEVQKIIAASCPHPASSKRVSWEETGCYSKPERYCGLCGQDYEDRDRFHSV